MPSTDELLNSSYMEAIADAQGDAEYDEYLDAEDARRTALAEKRKRLFELWTRTQEEMDDYDEDF